MRCLLRLSAALAALLLGSIAALAQATETGYRKAFIMSEGTRIAADVYWPKDAAGKKLPTIIMGHGWGGTAALLRPEAQAFAHAGYLVVAFDYRGWGESDSRVILTAPEPAARPDNRFTAEVQEVREVVDPLAEALDWESVVNWVMGEPMADTARIGLWGSSFAGGLVVYVAGQDHRIKAVHSQVGALATFSTFSAAAQADTYRMATQRARGEIGYPKPGAVVVENLRGAPIAEHFIFYSPAHVMNLAPDCAMQFVLAGNEELFDNKRATIEPYEKFRGTKKKLVVIPGITHYGIYGPARTEAQKLALAWFDKYLK